jgi:hypothetical protein
VILYISNNPFQDATCQKCNATAKEKMSNMAATTKEKVDKAKASTRKGNVIIYIDVLSIRVSDIYNL